MSKTTIIAKMSRDGRLTIRGRSAKPQAPQERSEEDIERAARDDSENPPLTKGRLAKLTRVPRIKTLRRALSLTQQEFAARYRIPVGTLRDWEQGRSEPDQPARAYLLVIARDPEGVRDFRSAGALAVALGIGSVVFAGEPTKQCATALICGPSAR